MSTLEDPRAENSSFENESLASVSTAVIGGKNDLGLITEILSELGLTQVEQRVYQVLAKYDGRPASLLAKSCGLNRSHAYEVLSRLVGRKFCSFTERNGVRYFRCISIEELLLYVERKEAFLAEGRTRIKSVLSAARRSSSDYLADPRSSSYRGDEARVRLLQEIKNRPATEKVVLICPVRDAIVFNSKATTVESVRKLLEQFPNNLKVALFSPDECALLVARELCDPRVFGIRGDFPSEILISKSRIALVGEKLSQPYLLTIDQPALAESLRALLRLNYPSLAA